MNLNTLVASKIKENRIQKGFSAEYISKEMNLSKSAYSHLENGKVEITISKLDLLSQILELPLNTFIPNAGGNTIINNDNSTGFIGNQINNLSNQESIQHLSSTIELLNRILDRLK